MSSVSLFLLDCIGFVSFSVGGGGGGGRAPTLKERNGIQSNKNRETDDINKNL
jgi:hypothetical protein